MGPAGSEELRIPHSNAGVITPGFLMFLGFLGLVGMILSMPLWGRFVVRALGAIPRALLFPFRLPGRLLVWRRQGRRARNYELLNRYLVELADHHAMLVYYRELIEAGISPRRLRRMLEEHLMKLRQNRVQDKVTHAMAEAQVHTELSRLSSEHAEMVARGRVELEQLRFTTKAMSGLVDQLNNKVKKEDAS